MKYLVAIRLEILVIIVFSVIATYHLTQQAMDKVYFNLTVVWILVAIVSIKQTIHQYCKKEPDE
jgi:hypothetical protein